MKVFQRELLVRTMRIVIVLPPTKQQGVNSQQLTERVYNWDTSTRPDENRLCSKPTFDGPGGSFHKRTFQR